MQAYTLLSKQERRYQLFYLIVILFLTLLVMGVLTLQKMDSPFSKADILEMQMLSQKNKFSDQAKIVFPLLESTFKKINIITLETPQPFVENDIKNNINEVANSFENTNIYDTRKEAYLQIAQFYKMFFEDKKIAAKKAENIHLFEKQFEECAIGFKDKEQQLAQKNNAILSRSNTQ